MRITEEDEAAILIMQHLNILRMSGQIWPSERKMVHYAKQCAMVTVNSILYSLERANNNSEIQEQPVWISATIYWQEVKHKIKSYDNNRS